MACVICEAKTVNARSLCKSCRKSYDEDAHDDSSVMGAIAWAGGRARTIATRLERGRATHHHTLIATVEAALTALDAEMRKPPTPERGSNIAKICNAVELAKDMAKRFGFKDPPPRRRSR